MARFIKRREFLQAGAGAALLGSSSAAAEDLPDESRKKGCCFTVRPESKWKERTRSLKAHWLYTWGADKPPGMLPGVEFSPMIWGAWDDTKLAQRIDRMRRQVEAGEIASLMGFNEPDQHDQSNMSVKKALKFWPRLMELGVPLVSPGCVHPDRQWMRNFMQQVDRQNLRVDYVAVHSYGGVDSSALMRRLTKVYKEFGRPLWITEFAVGDWNAKKVDQNRHSPQSVARFMKEVLPELEKASFVERYAWFSARQDSPALGTSALFDKAGRLTPLGKIYAKI